MTQATQRRVLAAVGISAVIGALGVQDARTAECGDYCKARTMRAEVRWLHDRVDAISLDKWLPAPRPVRLTWRMPQLRREHRYWRVQWVQSRASLPTTYWSPRRDAWLCIHAHEGPWNDTGDPYWGGLQMDRGFMRAYGPDFLARLGPASYWKPWMQMKAADRAYEGYNGYGPRGFGPWPNTARACGLL